MFYKNEIKYIKNYFDKEIYCVNKDVNIKNFISENKINMLNIKSENSSLKKGDLVFIENCNYIVHIVRPGETLNSIAKKYNTTIEDIIKNNKIKNVFIGQQVVIRL